MPTLEKRIADLKGVPLSAEEILDLKDSVAHDNGSVDFYCYNRNTVKAGSKIRKKSKIPYNFAFSLYNKVGRTRTPYKSNSKSKTIIYVFDEKGKAVIKKKLKTSKAARGVKGKLTVGTYLVIAWCDLEKDKRVGTCFYMTNADCNQ